MQVLDNRNVEHIPFAAVEIGEEFMYSERLHMRTDRDDYNAVDLEDGTLRHLHDGECINVVSAIITIQP